MLKLRICVVVCFVCGVMMAGASGASGHGEAKEKKVGILLVAFGSSEESAQSREKNSIHRKWRWPKWPMRISPM